MWPAADWYEREVWDLFGITFDGHQNLKRILLPSTWKGHPLRKEYPARATELGPVHISEEEIIQDEKALQFDPAQWGLPEADPEGDNDSLVSIWGPHHTGTHGVIRFVLQLGRRRDPSCGARHRFPPSRRRKDGANARPGIPISLTPTVSTIWECDE